MEGVREVLHQYGDKCQVRDVPPTPPRKKSSDSQKKEELETVKFVQGSINVSCVLMKFIEFFVIPLLSGVLGEAGEV